MNALVRLACRMLVSSGAVERKLGGLARESQPGLTILCYHRLGQPDPSGNADPSLYSAAPAAFSWQLAFLQRYFQVLSFEEVSARSRSGKALPPNTALLTFDDGYRDNFDLAYPLLREKGLSAAIYLITGMIGTQKHMWWDETAGLLSAAPLEEVSLPGLGRTSLKTSRERAQALKNLRRAWKTLPPAQREASLDRLRQMLGDPAGYPAEREYMDWDEVAAMRQAGNCFGAHTHTHPILTQVSLQTAEEEILRSQQAIEDVILQPCRLFAYPNGEEGQFNQQTRGLLAAHRFDSAVTLVRGRNYPTRAGFDWLSLKRVTINGKDNRDTFAVKLSGLLDQSPLGAGGLFRARRGEQAQP